MERVTLWNKDDISEAVTVIHFFISPSVSIEHLSGEYGDWYKNVYLINPEGVDYLSFPGWLEANGFEQDTTAKIFEY